MVWRNGPPSPNPNPNPNRKVIPNSRFEPKSKKPNKPKSKIDVPLSNYNIFKSFFVNRLPMLCCMFISPLIVLLYLIIELLTRSTIGILHQTINLSKSNRFNSFCFITFPSLYCRVCIIFDRFPYVLAKPYKINTIIQQVQILMVLRKQIHVYNTQINLRVQNNHSTT